MEDRLSTLPNDIRGLILSKIPIREAIRSSVLSKNWRYAYTYISKLRLSPYELLGRDHLDAVSDPTGRQRVEDIISDILRLHSSHVESFYLHPDDLWDFTAEKVSRWVQYAASKKVQRINLSQSPEIESPPPAALFTCAHLTKLTLESYNLSIIPNSFVGFNHLLSFTFHNVEFTDDSLAFFISRCPLLQKLELSVPVGLVNPVITAPNITEIHLDDDGIVRALPITITCPKLITVLSGSINVLRVNGVFFHELSSAVTSLQMERGSSLVELWLVLDERATNISAGRLLDIASNFKSLKKLFINIGQEWLERENEEMAVPLFRLLERLPHLQFLRMDGLFARALFRGHIPDCLSSPLANLRKVQVNLRRMDDKENAALGCLLQSTPALEIMELRIREEDIETAEYMAFVENLFSFRRASTQVRMCHGIIDEKPYGF